MLGQNTIKLFPKSEMYVMGGTERLLCLGIGEGLEATMMLSSA